MSGSVETPEKPNAPRKLKLEIAKLELEHEQLKRQLSPRGQFLDLLKAAAVPIAILGAFVSLYVGTRQSDEAREKRLTDSYANAFSQLSSTDPRQRISAAMRLNLFLPDAPPQHQSEIMSSLVGSLSLEQDAVVQDALVNAIDGAGRNSVPASTLDHILELTLQLNRRLLIHSLAQIEPKRNERGNLLFLGSRSATDLPGAIRLTAGPEILQNLGHVLALGGLSRAISGLIAGGAGASDFSGIYCQGCNFSPLHTIQRANFSHSILPDSSFENMVLRGADFTDVHLSATRFTGADLQGTDFSHQANDDSDYGETRPPIFACADLRGARLDGLLLLHQTTSLYQTEGGLSAELTLEGPRLDQVQMDSTTRLENLKIVHLLSIEAEAMRSRPPAAYVFDALRELAGHVRSVNPDSVRARMQTIQWRRDDDYVQRDTITLPLDDNALWSGMFLSVVSIYRYAADNNISDVERRFGLLARNVNASDAFFDQRHGHREGVATCIPGRATTTSDYRWYIYVGFDNSAEATRFLSTPFNPMDSAPTAPGNSAGRIQ